MQPRADRTSRVSRGTSAASTPASLGFTTTRGSTAGDRFRVDALSSTTSGPLLIHACGYQSDENNLWFLGGGGGLPWLAPLMADGWIIASSDFESGQSWGNEAASQTALDALITYVDSLYTVTHIVLEGLSMGGLVVLNHITAGSYDDRIRGVILGNALVDLAAIYAFNSGQYAASIDTAYGITNPPNYATATSGYDPILEAAGDYDVTSASGHKLRYGMWASPEDTAVDKSTHIDALDTLISTGGWESTVTETTGGHFDIEAYGDQADVKAFADRCVIDWPTATAAGTAVKAAASSVNWTIPAGVTEGDLMVVMVGAEGSSMTTVSATGWTVEGEGDFIGAHQYGLLYKIASASDEANAGSGTHTFTVDGSPTNVGAAGGFFTRFDSSDPFGTSGGGLGNGTSFEIPSFTIDGYNRLELLGLYGSTDSTLGWPTGYSQIAVTPSGGAGLQVGMAVKIAPNPGASGTRTVTASSTSFFFARLTQLNPVE